MPDETNNQDHQHQEQKSLTNKNKRYAKGFVMIPNWIIEHVGISRDAKLLYGLLQKHAWQSGECYPGYETLMAEMQCSRDALSKYIKELRESGLIEIKRRGLGLSNIYEIVDWTQEDFDQHLKQKSENRTSGSPEKRTSVVRKSDANKTQIEKDTELKRRKIRKANAFTTEKGGEGSAASARSQRERMATGKQNTRGVKNGNTKQEWQPAYIGKPLTQEEIDEKRKNGQNASGFTPLAGIIPASHWQELEARAADHPPTNGNGNGNYYSKTTKHAPLSIDATMEQLSKLLQDEPDSTAQNINRATKLCKQVGYDPDRFTDLLWTIYRQVKKKPDKLFKIRRADGRPNKMLVFFAELEKALGVKKKLPN